jgi:hypothetical protein
MTGMPSTPTSPSEPADRDPHDPEDAAALVADELGADHRDHATDPRLLDEAGQAAEEVEKEEDAE